MKKALIALLVLAAALSCADVYQRTQQADLQRAKYAALDVGQPFSIRPSTLLSDPDGWRVAYPLLRAAAAEAQVNVFRTSLGYARDDAPEIIHYVLLTGPTRFADALRIADGRFLTPGETQGAHGFLSTDDTGEPDQVGRLAMRGRGPRVEIRPLQQMNTYLPVPGQYWVEAANPDAYGTFVQAFLAAVNEHLPQDAPRRYTFEDFASGSTIRFTSGPVEDFGIWGRAVFTFVPQIRYLVAMLALVLMVYYGFQTANRIGILKLHGASNLRVWYIGAGRLVIGMFIASGVLSLAATAVVGGGSTGLAADVVQAQATFFGLVALASLALYIYSGRIRISDAIKHRKDTAGIFVLNLLIKVGWSVVLVALVAGLWFEFATLLRQEAMIDRWRQASQAQHVGVFAPTAIGHDLLGIIDGSGNQSREYVRSESLYPRLNAEGALYIDAAQYRESALRRPMSPGEIRSITVNPNYLRQVTLRDGDRQPIEISEDATDWIILVPEQYRDREQQILRFFQEKRRRAIANGDRFIGAVVPERLRAQQVRIVWLSSGQRLDSLDPAVFPDEGNVIVDPIIEVMTERNSLPFDRRNLADGSVSAALKVPLAGADPALTYQHLLPMLERLGLSEEMRQLRPIDEAIADEIATLRRIMGGLAAVAFGLFAVSLLLVAQSLTIYFTRQRRRILVYRLFGVGLSRTYRDYALLFAGGWLVQGLVGLAVVYRAATAGPPGAAPPAATIIVPVLAIIGVLLALELAGSVVVIHRIERRNLPEALKEGA